MKNNLLILAALLLLSPTLSGQLQQQNLDQFKEETKASVSLNKSTGMPGFISFSGVAPMSLLGATVVEKTDAFLDEHAAIFGITNANEELSLSKESTDNIGNKHLTYVQSYKGVPVFDGQLKFHYNGRNELQSINGVYIPGIKLNPVPSLSSEGASIAAIAFIEGLGVQTGSKVSSKHEQLYVFKKGLVQGVRGANHLVYEVEVVDELGMREFVYVDAHSSDIVEQFTGNHGALFRRLYEGNISNEVWTEGDAFPGSLNIWQRNEIVAAGHTYHMFANTFGYDSYDGAGAEMLTINNVNTPGFCPNASWNGVNANYCTGTASDDVVAHEWGHAYTEFTSGLIYAWQPGALNESYSDIWGETVDLLNGYEDDGEDLSLRTGCGSSQRWRMGEDASAFGGAIRDMYIPTCNGHPGKVSDNGYRCGTGDNGGVHSNSGVNNHAYALLVDGGTYNGQTITGIGLVKAAHIFWRAQHVYLTKSSGFDVQADALEMAGNDLAGINLEGISTTVTPAGLSGQVIDGNDLTQLSKVIFAVELRLTPSCVFTPLLAPAPQTCLESIPSTAIYHEGFESGLGGWIPTQHPVNPGTWEARDWVLEPTLPDSRATTGVFGTNPVNGDCQANLQNGVIRLSSPVIAIPGSTTGTIEMSFDHNVATEPLWDGANIKYNLNDEGWTILLPSAFTLNPYNGTINTAGAGNDNPLAGEPAFTGTDGGFVTGSWGISTINLSGLGLLPGGSIQFRFEVGGDGCNGSSFGWYVDDIRIYVCEDCMTDVVTARTWNVAHANIDADMTVTTTDTVSGSSLIVYSAENINMLQGFEVRDGAIMEANNDGCDEVPGAQGAPAEDNR